MTAEQFKKRFVCIYPKLFAVAVANIGNSEDAKDVMQSLYLKLWERRDELAGVDNDIGYCKTMLINICRDRWRSKILEPEWAAEEEVTVVDDAMVQGIEADDIRIKIEQFIARLPQKQKRIMTMRMQGATTEEIIEATGLSVENVRTILSRTRQLIREYYNIINR
ncbi:MAG: sigma-70 family RNA polymerase sigma factor [Bacteroidaceae bacterium]|nr:sigma-70 family RNA polymerase sigma factor [Bacteroidaceae bacterium]